MHDEVKVRRKRREREVKTKASAESEVQTSDIEELTSAGHRALQEG